MLVLQSVISVDTACGFECCIKENRKIVISVKIKNSGAFMLNKNLYKSIILIVIVFICFLTNSIVASAVTEQQSEGWIYTIEDNAVKITGYAGTETVLNIPSEIDGYQVYSITGLAGNNNIQR